MWQNVHNYNPMISHGCTDINICPFIDINIPGSLDRVNIFFPCVNVTAAIIYAFLSFVVFLWYIISPYSDLCRYVPHVCIPVHDHKGIPHPFFPLPQLSQKVLAIYS